MTDEKKRETPRTDAAHLAWINYTSSLAKEESPDEAIRRILEESRPPNGFDLAREIETELAQEREDRKLIDEAATRVDKQNAELREQLEHEREARVRAESIIEQAGHVGYGTAVTLAIEKQQHRADKLESQLSAARAALNRYSRHDLLCERPHGSHCNCGLQHAIEQIGGEKGTECP